MFIPQQSSAQAQQQAQQQLQQQIQQQVQQAIEQGMRAADEAGAQGRMSADAKQQLKEQIRAAIDAAREASAEAKVIRDADGRLTIYAPSPGPGFAGRGGARNNDIPEQVPEILGIMGITLVCCVVGFPLARAFARMIDRRGATPPVNREVVARLEAIEQAVESVAVEVERISEGQRFTTRMLSERTHEPAQDFAGNRERVPVDLAGTPANARRG
jgi:multidrug efflux pump subunit AcrA (membrane-fusion protein)